jgi:hypothetical protein
VGVRSSAVMVIHLQGAVLDGAWRGSGSLTWVTGIVLRAFVDGVSSSCRSRLRLTSGLAGRARRAELDRRGCVIACSAPTDVDVASLLLPFAVRIRRHPSAWSTPGVAPSMRGGGVV